MIEAVHALSTGRYRERASLPPLQRFFARTWVHQLNEDETQPIIVTPDAAIDLQWVDGEFWVAGPDMTPKIEILPKGTTVIGFRFRPASAAAWLGIPAIELLGKRVKLEDLWGSSARRLAGEVPVQQPLADVVTSLETLLEQNMPLRPIDQPMLAAFDLIDDGPPPGKPLLPWLQCSLAMSERTLRRRFDETYGYGPKTLDRILRFQRFLKLSRMSRNKTALLAAEAGYADQAHLVRESRRLSGSTPHQLERLFGQAFAEWVDQSSGSKFGL